MWQEYLRYSLKLDGVAVDLFIPGFNMQLHVPLDQSSMTVGEGKSQIDPEPLFPM